MAYPKIGHWRNKDLAGETLTWRQYQDEAEAEFGAFQGHWADYISTGEAPPLQAAHLAAIAAGKLLHIYWKPWTTTWANVASGGRDAHIDQGAASIASVAPVNVWLTIGHEPENDVNNTAGSGFTYSDYKNMWQRVRDRFNLAGVTNVTWVFVSMGNQAHPTELLNLWPGNGLVDINAPQIYIVCSAPATNLVDKWIAHFDWLETNRTTDRAWSYTDMPVAITEWNADHASGAGCNTEPPTPYRGTVSHRAATLNDVTARLGQLEAYNCVELKIFDARYGFLKPRPSADAEAYAGLKTVSEANQGGPGPGVITERALASNTATSGTTSATTISVSPTGMQQNDWLIFQLTSAGGAATHTNTGGSLTRIHTDFTQANTLVLSTWKKKCGSSEAGPYTFSIGATTRRIGVICHAYAGGNSTDIVEVVGTTAGASAQSLAIPGVTPGGTLRWHILFEASNSATPDDDAVTFTQPANYTEDNELTSEHATSANARMAYAHRELPDASATGDKTFNIAGGVNRALVGSSIVLVPEAGATGVSAFPTLASVIGVSNQPAIAGVRIAAVTATANQPTISSSAVQQVPAGVATVSAIANQPSLSGPSPRRIDVEFTANAWTDITDYVLAEQGPIEIRRGRPDELSTVQPATISLWVNNSDGRFTPGLSSSPYYPNVRVGKRIRITVNTSAGTFIRFTGRINAWPTAWQVVGTPPFMPAQITATDDFKRLGEIGELRSMLEEEILKDAVPNGSYSAVYYPLAEPNESITIASATKHTQAVGFIVQNGTGGTIEFGAGTGPGTDELSAVMFTPVNTSNGKLLRADLTQPIGHPTSGVTLECWFRADSGIINRTIAILAGYENGDPSYLQLGIGSDGKLHGTRIKDGVFKYDIISSTTVNDNETHHAVVKESDTGATATGQLFLDNVSQGTQAYSEPTLPAYIRLRIGGDSFGPNLFTGTIAHVAAYSTALSTTRISDHYHAGKDGLAGERTDQRIGRIADYISYPTANRAFDIGDSTVGWQGTSGAQPLSAMQESEQTEFGVLFISMDDKLTFHGRSRRYNASVGLTLDAQQAAQLRRDLEFPGDDLGLTNDARITRARGPEMRAVNQDSIDLYGLYRSSRTVISETDNQAQAAADWLVNNYGEPKTRVTPITVDLYVLSQQNPSLVTTVLNAEISTKLRLANLPAQAPATTIDAFIEGWTETLGVAMWTIQFNCSPADFANVWELGVAGFSELGVTTRLGF